MWRIISEKQKIVKHIPVLCEVINNIMRAIGDECICHAPTLGLKEWGTYGGFRLETDWKSRTRKACDIPLHVNAT
ncbi:MAG: hypothetical protein GX024_01755 [Clostridiales bacterium]|nr:hypothetical protein [Clostridiales bacterium]